MCMANWIRCIRIKWPMVSKAICNCLILPFLILLNNSLYFLQKLNLILILPKFMTQFLLSKLMNAKKSNKCFIFLDSFLSIKIYFISECFIFKLSKSKYIKSDVIFLNSYQISVHALTVKYCSAYVYSTIGKISFFFEIFLNKKYVPCGTKF
jgi:hypothetical protein